MKHLAMLIDAPLLKERADTDFMPMMLGLLYINIFLAKGKRYFAIQGCKSD
jgi:hypothetical protein